MLPANTASILQFLGFADSVDFSVGADSDGVVSIEVWSSVQPQPTEQEIIDAGNDLTLVNGQTFSTWLAEHGGDTDLTRRRLAKELIDKVNANEQVIRALAIAVNARTNQIALRVNQILDAIDSANNLAQMQSNIGAIADLPEIQKTALKTIILGYITSGETDGALED